MHRCQGDRGFVVGWFTRILLILAVAGVIGHEGISIATTHVGGQDIADAVAREGSKVLVETRGDVQRAYTAAAATAESRGATLDRLDFAYKGGTVTVTIHKQATSLLLRHIPSTREWLDVKADSTVTYIRP